MAHSEYDHIVSRACLSTAAEGPLDALPSDALPSLPSAMRVRSSLSGEKTRAI